MFFSAAAVLGSRLGSVGSPVSGCPRAAWVWSVRHPAPFTLALALPPRSNRAAARAVAVSVSRRFGVSCAVRFHRGRWFVRVRGSRPVLLSVARWFAGVGA